MGRKIMLGAGLATALLATAIWFWPGLVVWLPQECLWLLLLGPIFFLVGLGPPLLVRWAMRHAMRIALFLVGGVLIVIGCALAVGAAHDPQSPPWATALSLGILLFGLACVGVSLAGSRSLVERFLNGF